MDFSTKDLKLLEIFYKALANQRRVKVLFFVNKKPRLNVEEICDELKMNYQTGASHIQRLEKVGFLYKNYKGLRVEHVISERGREFIKFSKNILRK